MAFSTSIVAASDAAMNELLSQGQVWLAERAGPLFQRGVGRTHQTGCVPSRPQIASFGNANIDNALPHGGLPTGAVHEWFLKINKTDSARKGTPQVPHTIINTLAANLFKQTAALDIEHRSQKDPPPQKFILWIGKHIWPTPFLLEQVLGQEFFGNCVFIDPPRGKLTLWAIETALRSPATVALIAECPNISFAISRRLSIAAQKGGGLGLLVRNIAELSKPTMVSSRWLLEPTPSKTDQPAWQLTLLKYKGGLPNKNQWIA